MAGGGIQGCQPAPAPSYPLPPLPRRCRPHFSANPRPRFRKSVFQAVAVNAGRFRPTADEGIQGTNQQVVRDREGVGHLGYDNLLKSFADNLFHHSEVYRNGARESGRVGRAHFADGKNSILYRLVSSKGSGTGVRHKSEDRRDSYFCGVNPCVYTTLGQEATFMMMPKSLESLAQRRVQITDQIAALSDLRCGSFTSTTGRCGKPNCHCHQPKDPGHGPNLRLTYKVDGKSVTESLPDQAAIRKAEREIAEFRKWQALQREFVEVNARICQIRPPEPDTLLPEEKKLLKRSARKSRAN